MILNVYRPFFGKRLIVLVVVVSLSFSSGRALQHAKRRLLWLVFLLHDFHNHGEIDSAIQVVSRNPPQPGDLLSASVFDWGKDFTNISSVCQALSAVLRCEVQFDLCILWFLRVPRHLERDRRDQSRPQWLGSSLWSVGRSLSRRSVHPTP